MAPDSLSAVGPMEMDGTLYFEVLLYLNSFYFLLFTFAELVIVLAKYSSDEFSTPNIELDAAVLFVILTAEAIKLVVFRKIRDSRPGLSNFVAITLSMISAAGLVYILVIQHPVLKMEYMVCGVMLALMIGILAYGLLQFTPCCTKKQNM